MLRCCDLVYDLVNDLVNDLVMVMLCWCIVVQWCMDHPMLGIREAGQGRAHGVVLETCNASVSAPSHPRRYLSFASYTHPLS